MTAPAYEDDTITLYRGDALSVLAEGARRCLTA